MVSIVAATGAITVLVMLVVIHRIWRLPDNKAGRTMDCADREQRARFR